LNFILQGRASIIKQEMGFIKEKHQFRFFQIANFGKLFKQLGEHPEQEGGIQLRRVHQLVSRQQIDIATALTVRLQQVHQIQRRLAKKTGHRLGQPVPTSYVESRQDWQEI